jgi:hypothetical protein
LIANPRIFQDSFYSPGIFQKIVPESLKVLSEVPENSMKIPCKTSLNIPG